jgi:hypothetical protein
MARTTPRVEESTSMVALDGADAILIGTPAWYAWLEQSTTFAFIGLHGSFTARKERRGRTGWYWKAYRKHAGKVSSAYLGKSADLTLPRLQSAATTLATAIHPANQLTQRDITAAPQMGTAPTLPSDIVISVPEVSPRSQLLIAAAPRPYNLPIPPTALIGRERDLAAEDLAKSSHRMPAESVSSTPLASSCAFCVRWV